MKIKLLDESTINKIAAGEVVERPASVVKELIENALDAGATRITIDAETGGKTLIRIADNGDGMTLEDAKLSLQRHATSKIAKVEDLFSIHTLGFRGEAVPSIAGVSRFTLETCPRGESKGVCLVIEGGQLIEEKPTGMPSGTIMTVRDLFFNVPARQKFLKTEHTELSKMVEVVEKFILLNPSVQFIFQHQGKVITQSTGQGKLLESITSVYGKSLVEQLVPVHLATAEGMEVSGYISLPTHLKNDRRDQSLFVNGRPIFDPLLGKAIREGYRNMIPSDRHPVVFLFLKVDPALVDVNVHPAKREVRFARSQDVFAAVRSAVGNALLVGGLPSSTGILPVHSPVRTGEGEPRPFDKLRDRWDEGWKPAMFPKLETLFDTEKASLPQVPAPLPSMNFSSCEPSYAEATAGRPRTPLFQIANTYIVTMLDGELALIDQHAAHEKILFEKFSQSAATTEVASQQLLVPITLDLNAKEAVLFAEQQPALNRLGFEIEPFGGTTFLIRAVPAEIADQNISEVLQATFSELIETEHGRIDQDALLKMMACKAAVKAGDALKPEELSQLVRQLQTNPALRTCPHGRPVVVKMTQKELAKMFGR